MNSTVIDDYEKLNLPVKESYETLRANIQLYNLGTKIKSLTMLGYGAGEGKTTTAINLSITMAKSGLKVLFVDADFHKPELMKNLKGVNSIGLSNILLGYTTLSEAINSTSEENFSFISSGTIPSNPTALLGSTGFKELLINACSLYDIVIFDTPPLGSVIDSLMVASQTFGAIFVIQPGRVSSKYMQRITNQLHKAKVNLLGVVLNRIPTTDYRNYQKEYDYYGSDKRYSRKWLKKIRNSRES